MEMLSRPIQTFIDQIRQIDQVGGVLVPRAKRAQLLALLGKADVIIGPKPSPGRVTFYPVSKSTKLHTIVRPALLVITEEDYYPDPAWQVKIRDVAGMFMKVE